jgi:hypothetical protein
MPRSFKCFFPFWAYQQILYAFIISPYVLHSPHISPFLIWLSKWYKCLVKLTNYGALHMQFSSTSCNFICSNILLNTLFWTSSVCL